MHSLSAHLVKIIGAGVGALAVLVVVFGYFQLHPTDGFYLKEFARVTLRDPPNSSRVVAKSFSPCSYSRIELSQQDYLTLFENIATDHQFVVGTKRYESLEDGKLVIHEESKILETDNQHDVWNAVKHIPERASFVRLVPNDRFQHYSLIFLADERHIEVNSCRT